MQDQISCLKNEDGAAILVALMVLMAATIIGVSSSSKTTMELQVVRNDGVYKQNFYQAEGAAHEAIQLVWDQAQDDPYLLKEKTSLSYVNSLADVDSDFDDRPDLIDPGFAWDHDGQDDNDNSAASGIAALAGTVLSAVDLGVSRPGSIEMTGTNVYDYAIFGLSTQNDGRACIQIGWRIRY